jgi:hypothetical protein
MQVQAYSPLQAAKSGLSPVAQPADDALPEIRQAARLLADLAKKKGRSAGVALPSPSRG